MKLSIRWVLILGFLGMIWATQIITTTSSYVSSQKVLLGHARDIMENIADFAMAQSQNYLALAQGATHLTKRLITANVVSSDKDQANILEQYFYDQLSIYTHFAGIYFGMPNGDFFYVSRNTDRPGSVFRTKSIHHANGLRETWLTWRDKDFKELFREKTPGDTFDPRLRPWYKKALKEKQFVWTDPYIFYTSQKPGITIAGPTYNEIGTLKGIVGVDIEIDHLSIFIGKLRIGKSGRAFMINRDNDVVAFHDLDKITFRAAGSLDKTRLVKIHEIDDVLSKKAFNAVKWECGKDKRLLLEKSCFSRFKHEGNNYYVMFTPFSAHQWPWIIGVYIPEDDYLGSIKDNRRFNIFIAIGISILATLIGLQFARSIIRPIANLEKEALAVRNQDYKTSFDTHSNYVEIQETADSFSHMKEAIKQSETSLKKYRERLEKLVEERTVELIEANENLKQEIEERRIAGEMLRRREEELKAAQRYSQNLIDSSLDMIIATDLDRKIVKFNRAAEKTFGYRAKEIIGEYIDILYKGPDDGLRIHKETMKEGGYIGEIINRRKNGRTFPTFFSIAILRDSYGKPIGTMGISRDITGLKEAEIEKNKLQAQLLHSQKIESIGTVASGVAHNFRNILAGISINTQFINMRYVDDPGLQDIASRTSNYIQRGKQLVEGLMQFSRKQTGDRFKNLNLAEAIENTYDLINESFDKMIDIRIDVAESLPVFGDGSGLRQVLMNICNNARDAMPDGGILRIVGRRKGGKVEVEISDTGFGMDKETLKNCFDPFYTTKDVDKGTGLGLSTTYGIVKDHGGEIYAYSEIDIGTTFRLLFPLNPSGVPTEDASSTEIVRGGGMKVLIVDDEEEMLKPMEDLLEGMGYNADSVTNGKDAVARYMSWHPDAVLLDRNMPEMDGITCAKKILDHNPHAGIIIISGYDEEGPNGIDSETKELISGYLTKPIDIIELSRVLGRLLKK